MNKQIDIFGNETNVQVQKSKKSKKTIKQKFRAINGYDESNKCKDCVHRISSRYHDKILHKCEMIGLTHSEATDIRLKDFACNLFEKRGD